MLIPPFPWRYSVNGLEGPRKMQLILISDSRTYFCNGEGGKL